MKIEKTTYLNCFCDFSHGARIRTESGRFLGATCDPGEAENIIKAYFRTEFFPEPVHVYFSILTEFTTVSLKTVYQKILTAGKTAIGG